jgi:alpha-amylase/alpha-mannosidase (GH57 family)
MASSTQLQFVWHFHQPYYSTPDRGRNTLPWVRLHAIKSYYDMGRMLEQYPEVHCTINLSGSLLEQLREYLDVGKRDTWWYLTEKPAAHLTQPDKLHLLRHFFSLDWSASVEPIPAYRDLLEKRGREPDELDPDVFSEQEYRDLQVLFNLAWFGFSARRERTIVQALLEKGSNYSEDEKRALLEQQIEVMQLLIPLYRKLHARDQVELSVTPMYHPIMPLLLDTESAAEPMPDASLPPRLQAPEDAETQIEQARAIARDLLGVDVTGMWPAEGAISPETVELFETQGLRWCASDEAILARSRGDDWSRADDLYRPWQLGDGRTQLFFRDREISDQIGFVYKQNDPARAVDDFFERIDSVASSAPLDAPLVSIILDGENPWIHYPNAGEDFLHELFGRISEADRVETVTPTDVLEDRNDASVGRLDRLASGSWIAGDFGIWIGADETNRAWELLGETRRTLMELEGEMELSEAERKRAWNAIHIAEGSDWFWWYGDDFTSENDADFDRLFRDQLRFVYNLLGREVPEALNTAIMEGGTPQISFDPPKQLIQPRIDGQSEYYYEWSGAGVYRNTGAHGSMFENTRYVDEIRIGFDPDHLYMRIDPGPDLMGGMTGIGCRIDLQTDEDRHVVDVTTEGGVTAELYTGDTASGDGIPLERVAFDDCLEVAIPFNLLDAFPGDRIGIRISVREGRLEREHHPTHDALEIEVPDETFEARNWMV